MARRKQTRFEEANNILTELSEYVDRLSLADRMIIEDACDSVDRTMSEATKFINYHLPKLRELAQKYVAVN